MSNDSLKDFCKGGGWTSKLGPEVLHKVLEDIPKKYDENLLIGYESSDDAAVYKITEDIAIVMTLDFFSPIVEDAYMFGKIAAANALSDVYAMGAEVKTALNIVSFPEKLNPEILKDILRGGAEKVEEAGGILSGGHSVNDESIKYGLSVTGIVNPKKILANNGCLVGDKIILTKPLGVGIIMAAKKMNEANEEEYEEAVNLMQTLNKYSAKKMLKYDVRACTDVTGFGFLGHLHEMVSKNQTIIVDSKNVPFVKGAYKHAKEFYITGLGQKNRNFLKGKVMFESKDFALEEIMLDPQTSGGLLISVSEEDAHKLLNELNESNIKSKIVAEVVKSKGYDIIVK